MLPVKNLLYFTSTIELAVKKIQSNHQYITQSLCTKIQYFIARQYFLTWFIYRSLFIENSAINHLIDLLDELPPRTFNASLERSFVTTRPFLGNYALQFDKT